MDERIPWGYTADYYESCNCLHGCDCNFGGFPDKGHCRFVVAYRIREGRHGDTDLAGAQFVMAGAFPGALHQGNGTVALFLDESTNEAQREALARILMGLDGGLPYEITASMVTNVLGPFVTKTDIEWDGTDSRVRVGDRVSSELETFRNPVTGERHEVHVVIPKGFIWTDASSANAKRISVDVDGMSFTDENTSGFSAVVTHTNQA